MVRMRVALVMAILLAGLSGCNEDGSGADGFGRMKAPEPRQPSALRPVVAPKPREAYKVQPVNAPKPVQPFEVKAAREPQPVQPYKAQPAPARPYDPQMHKAPVIRPDPKHVAAQQLLE